MISLLPPQFARLELRPDVRPLADDVIGNVAEILWILLAAVGVVLFIACANVANLFLVRSEARHQEFAMRAALGASRSRIARALLSESVVLALAGGTAGVVLAQAATAVLRAIAPAELPRVDDIGVNPDRPVVHSVDLGVERSAVRPGGRVAIRQPARRGTQGRRPIDNRRAWTAPHPSCAGRRTSGVGTDAAHRRRTDDSDVPRDARNRPWLQSPERGPDVRHRDTSGPHQ